MNGEETTLYMTAEVFMNHLYFLQAHLDASVILLALPLIKGRSLGSLINRKLFPLTLESKMKVLAGWFLPKPHSLAQHRLPVLSDAVPLIYAQMVCP